MHQNFNEALTPPSLEYLAQTLPARLEAFNRGGDTTYTDELEQPCKDGTGTGLDRDHHTLHPKP